MSLKIMFHSFKWCKFDNYCGR